jgi:hypothetical protein
VIATTALPAAAAPAPVSQRITTAAAIEQAGCTILDLTLGPLHLNLLGNLLCAIAGLLDGTGTGGLTACSTSCSACCGASSPLSRGGGAQTQPRPPGRPRAPVSPCGGTWPPSAQPSSRRARWTMS